MRQASPSPGLRHSSSSPTLQGALRRCWALAPEASALRPRRLGLDGRWTPTPRRLLALVAGVLGLYCLALYALHGSVVPVVWREAEPCTHSYTSRQGMHSTYQHPNHTSACQVHRFWETLSRYEDLEQFYLCQRVLYNRVPKCASRTVLSTFKKLAKDRTFNLIADPAKMSMYFLNHKQEEEFIQNFSSHRDPLVYSRHILYINFTRHHVVPPVYINVIRDPLDRVVSHFYYNKNGDNNKRLVNSSMPNVTLDECVRNQKKPCFRIDRLLAFFCGSDNPCKKTNDHLLSIAKRTVKRDYLVVGLMEDLEGFMELLETTMPHFFANATSALRHINFAKKNLFSTVEKRPLEPETKRTLMRMLAQEYEFYAFVKQRFYNLLHKVRVVKQKLYQIKPHQVS